MPKLTKLPQMDNPHWIQKSHPLASLSNSDWTLSTLQILDAYLDKINMHKTDTRVVTFRRKKNSSARQRLTVLIWKHDFSL